MGNYEAGIVNYDRKHEVCEWGITNKE